MTISEPIPIETLTQSDLIKFNGVIKVIPEENGTQQQQHAQIDEQNQPQAVNGSEQQQVNTNELIEESTQTSELNRNLLDDETNARANGSVIDSKHDDGDEVDGKQPTTETVEQIITTAWFWGGITRKEAEDLLRGQMVG